jgi:hypothetical protein
MKFTPQQLRRSPGSGQFLQQMGISRRPEETPRQRRDRIIEEGFDSIAAADAILAEMGISPANPLSDSVAL